MPAMSVSQNSTRRRATNGADMKAPLVNHPQSRSYRTLADEATVMLGRAAGHDRVGEFALDGRTARLAELAALGLVGEQFEKGLRQGLGVFARHQSAPARRFDQFWKRPVRRLHDRHAMSQRFQNIESLRFAKDCRDRKYVQRLQEVHL